MVCFYVPCFSIVSKQTIALPFQARHSRIVYYWSIISCKMVPNIVKDSRGTPLLAVDKVEQVQWQRIVSLIGHMFKKKSWIAVTAVLFSTQIKDNIRVLCWIKTILGYIAEKMWWKNWSECSPEQCWKCAQCSLKAWSIVRNVRHERHVVLKYRDTGLQRNVIVTYISHFTWTRWFRWWSSESYLARYTWRT